MKHKRRNHVRFLLALFAVTLTFGCMSCSDDEEPGITANEGQMVAIIDGQKRIFTAVSVDMSVNQILIMAMLDGTALTLHTENQEKGLHELVGEADFQESTITFTTKPDVGSVSTVFATYYFPKETSVGEIVIKELNRTTETISGTFSCRLKETKTAEQREMNIVSGSFNKIKF